MHILFCDIGASIRAGFDTFMYTICTFIYGLIIDLYNVFDLLCRGRLLDNEFMQAISFRVSLILGLLMFFRVVFSFIQYLINPDTINDKEKGALNLVKKILVVIVLLGTYSYIFDFAFKVQNLLLGDNEGNVNVISRLLLPEIVESDNFGGVLSSELFLTFYNMNDRLIPESYRDANYDKCVNYRNALGNGITNYREFSMGYHCLDDKYMIDVPNESSGESNSVRIINFNSFLAPVVGIFVAWVLLMYCLSVGVRIIQFAFLEIIAPVAIISNLAPGKDNAFQKWGKMCATTYFDVFIRVAIIDFIVLIIANIINGFNSYQGIFWESMFASGNSSVLSSSMGFIKVIIILALLTFAKKAPELVKELLPKSWVASGDFGFSLKKRLDNMVGGNFVRNLPSRAIGFGVGALGGGLMSAASRFNTNKKRYGGMSWKDVKGEDGKIDRDKLAMYSKNKARMLLGGGAGLVTGVVRGGFGAAHKGNIIKNVGGAFKNVKTADDTYNNLILSGGSTLGKLRASLVDKFGETKGQEYTRRIADLEKLAGYKKSMNSAADEIAAVANAKTAFENIVQFPGEDQVHFQNRKFAAQARYKAIRKAAQNAAFEGVEHFSWDYETGFDVSAFDLRDTAGYTSAISALRSNLETQFKNYVDIGDPSMRDDRIRDRDEKINAIMSNYVEFIRDASDPDYTGSKVFDYTVSDAAKLLDDDDRGFASQIRAAASQAESYRSSHNVQHYDRTHGWVDVPKITDRGSLSAVSAFYQESTATITGSDDYAAAIANDQAAGVNSNASKK